MSDVVNVRRSLASLEKQETFDGYSKVIINVSDDVVYSSGTDTGRVLTLECPWGTQAMANGILARIRGFQYQPYTAGDAYINPAAELGDGFSAGNVYSGIYKKDVSHGPLYTANVAAPGGEKINYKYEYKSPTTRKIERQYKETKASLTVLGNKIIAEVTARESDTETLTAALNLQAGQISAKVSRTGGSASSFGWKLLADSWTLSSNGGTVLKADKGGLKVTGEIEATSGKIGGFVLKNGYLSTNNQTWGGTNTNGIYIGSSGIQLGKNFKVDSGGNLTAYSGTFLGTVRAKCIEYGGNDGYFDGAGLTEQSIWGSRVGTGALGTRPMTGGVQASLGYADYANGVWSGYNTPARVQAGSVTATDSLYVPYGGGTRRVSVSTVTISGKVYNILII